MSEIPLCYENVWKHKCVMTQLIFLPGASGSTDFWAPLAIKLQDYPDQKIVAYPAFANEPAHDDVQDFSSLSRYVLDHIQDECIIIAQSMGGIFAVQAALEKPEKVKGLVLIATSGGIDMTAFQVEDWRTAYQQHYLNYPDWFSTVKLDYAAQLENIRQPVLQLWGDADLISPVAVGEFLQQQLASSSLHVVAGGDHLFASSHADICAVHISAFLKQF